MKLKTIAKGFTLVSQLGYIMVTPILVCVLVGGFIDQKAHTEPIFTIILLLLGVGGAFRNLFYYVGKEIKKEDKDDKDE